MYLFIATIFIAELIIALALVLVIVSADKKVCELNNKLTSFRPILEDGLKTLKEVVSNLQDSIETFFGFIRKKRQQFTMKIIIAIVMYGSLFFFKGKYKKAASIFQLIVLVKDYWDELTI